MMAGKDLPTVALVGDRGALDIAASGAYSDQIWALSTHGEDNVYTYRDSQGWVNIDGMTGKRIAVSENNNRPYVVNKNNDPYYWNGLWVKLSASSSKKVRDISVSWDGTRDVVWMVSNNSGAVYRLTSSNTWENMGFPLTGSRIAADLNNPYACWVVATTNELYCYNLESSGNWEQAPAPVSFALDVGIGKGDAGSGLSKRIYVVSTETYPNTDDQYKIYCGTPTNGSSSVTSVNDFTWNWLCGQGTTVCGAGSYNGCLAINTDLSVLKYDGNAQPQPPEPGKHYWDELQ
jgi:hypothetical protein